MAMKYDSQEIIRDIEVWTDFEILEVKVSTIFSGT